MTIDSIMTRDPITLSPQNTLRDVIELQRSKRIRHVPIIDDSRVVGIVTDRDVKRATPSLLSGISREVFDSVLETTTLSQIMTRDPMTITSKTSLRAVVKIMIENRFGALPVVDNNQLVGIVTDTDLLRAFYEILPEGG